MESERVDPIYGYIDGKIKSTKSELRRELKKLAERLESLELMAFQDQISKLGDEVKVLRESLSKTDRFVALTLIEELVVHMQDALAEKS